MRKQAVQLLAGAGAAWTLRCRRGDPEQVRLLRLSRSAVAGARRKTAARLAACDADVIALERAGPCYGVGDKIGRLRVLL